MTKTAKTKVKQAAAGKSKSKTEQVLTLLGRPAGASIPELMRSTGWQAHSIRGLLAGSLKKKGHSVSSQVDEGGVRRYRLAAQAEL